MRKNPAALLGAGFILVGAGFVAGYLVAEKRATVEQTAATKHPDSATIKGFADRLRREPLDAAAAADDERAKLRDRILVLETQLRTSRPDPDRSPSPQELAELGRLAYEDMLALESGKLQDPERLRSLLTSLSRMDPALARVLIDRYRSLRSAAAGTTEQFVAIQLALMCGGPEATTFIQGVLTDPSLDAELRSKVLGELGSTGVSFFSIQRLPIDDSLGSTAMTLVRSTSPGDRRAGAGLLGGVSTPASRGELVQLLGDSDGLVKLAAIRSLGLVGDATTRKLLEPLAALTDNEPVRQAAAAAIQEIDRTPK